MSNFIFLQSGWPEIYDSAQEAEAQLYQFPRSSTIMCRATLEQMIKWMYENDQDLQLPESPTLEAMMYHPSFKEAVHVESLINDITVIRKQGNAVAHKAKRISATDALANLKYLYRFAGWFSRYYGRGLVNRLPDFDQTKLPLPNLALSGKEDITGLQQRISQQAVPMLRAKEEAILSEQEKELIADRLAATELLKASHSQPIESPLVISEAETRRRFIDLFLEEAGWDTQASNVKEYPVLNDTIEGRADYVLWDENGLPLAVVEAKRTMRNAKEGQQQALRYADALEKMTGQRPVIFYTNGFECWLWDDKLYPPRKVSGFYTKEELQLLIHRRHSRLHLAQQLINKNIIDRYYQEEAVKRVADRLENKYRGALLVMATGTGKTRVAAALVDMLTKANWAKRILFLADRNALVTQAKRNFNSYLPNLPAIDLTKEDDDGAASVVFSTYPTMLNRIDAWKNNKRLYTSGYFDVIIVDEAHRSVYNRYKAIFEYFDAIRIGLTATPKISGIDINTYELFGQEDHIPAFNYELDEAVEDKYLVPPKALKVPLKFTRDGIKYYELSDEEKKDYEEKFGDPTKGAPSEIASDALNNWLFNADTVDKVLSFLLEKGQKVEGGDKLGKTIIFARSNDHADFIEERFNKLRPDLKGHFLRVVTYKVSQVDDLIDKFKDPEAMPQIAVSVDMLDTGIDIPEILNLVFFKPVYSASKYWQMIGRGTRLCPNIFGPENNKKFFYIFDYCENFDFFQHHPDGIESTNSKPLTQRIFENKLDIATTLEATQWQEDEVEYLTYRSGLIKELHQKIANLNSDSFLVRQKIQQYQVYKSLTKWQPLTTEKRDEIKQHLSGLVTDTLTEEFAKRFDLLLLNIQLYKLQNSSRVNLYTEKAIEIAHNLSLKDTIPVVVEKMSLIKKATEATFWQKANIVAVEEMRKELRDLMYCLDTTARRTFYTNFSDSMDGEIEEFNLVNASTRMEGYKRRVEKFIRENESHIAIHKLKNNLPITTPDIAALEKIMFEGDLGTKADFIKEYGAQPLGVFIRSIIGLDRTAVNQAFSYFLQTGNLSADQIRFVDSIVNHLTERGIIEPEKLLEPPFTDIHDQGVFGLFDEIKADELINIIRNINDRAVEN